MVSKYGEGCFNIDLTAFIGDDEKWNICIFSIIVLSLPFFITL
jgi:hypothetical protein